MFTAYIDDAGTAPEQKVAMARALVVPVNRITALQSEWDTFVGKWGISEFHTSECAAANSKSAYAGWDEPKIDRVFKRVRQIIRKYGVRAFSLAVHRSTYEAEIPLENRLLFGVHHYTYAVHNMLAFLDEWACRNGVESELEIVFDWMGHSQKSQKEEIEDALARSEEARPGRFAGHYSFRNRREVPGLQCVDLIGWTCYRFSLNAHNRTPLARLPKECWDDFSGWGDGKWLTAIGQSPQQIAAAVELLKKYDGTKPLQVRPSVLT